MEDVRVDKAQLLDTLRENRDAHRKEFLKAQEVFKGIVIKNIDEHRDKLVALLDERLEEARHGRKVTLKFHIPALPQVPEPEDYTSSYDRAIKMMEWEKGDEVMLSEHDFQRYVLNDWEWAQSFASNTTSYASMAR